MKIFITITLLLTSLVTSFAQAELNEVHNKWASKVFVILKDGTRTKGWLHSVTDSSILLVSTDSYESFMDSDRDVTTYLFSDLKRIRVRKKRGWLKGGAKGLAVGGMIFITSQAVVYDISKHVGYYNLLVAFTGFGLGVMSAPVGIIWGAQGRRINFKEGKLVKMRLRKLKKIKKGAMFPL